MPMHSHTLSYTYTHTGEVWNAFLDGKRSKDSLSVMALNSPLQSNEIPAFNNKM